MYIYMCVYEYVYVYTYVCTKYIYMYIEVFRYKYIYLITIIIIVIIILIIIYISIYNMCKSICMCIYIYYIYTCMYKCIYTHICDLLIPESQMTHFAPINYLVVIIHNQSRAIPFWCSRYTQANYCLISMGRPSQHASWYLSRYLYWEPTRAHPTTKKIRFQRGACIWLWTFCPDP